MTDITARRHRGNPESAAANRDVEPSKVMLRGEIWMWLRKNGPATCEEAEIALRLRHQTCSARFSELLADGWAARTGETRKTMTGSKAAVVRAVTKAEHRRPQQVLMEFLNV